MSSYTLSNNAADIDAAISSVVGADATPTAGSQNMVTSGGVRAYVDGAVGDFAGKTITTEATGIENTDDDTSIPTSAAVIGYVPKAVYGLVNQGSTNVTGVLPIVEISDSNNLGNLNSGTITLPAGAYVLSFSGEFNKLNAATFNASYYISLQHNGNYRGSNPIPKYTPEDEANYPSIYITTRNFWTAGGDSAIVSSHTAQTVRVYINRNNNYTNALSYRNVYLHIFKIG